MASSNHTASPSVRLSDDKGPSVKLNTGGTEAGGERGHADNSEGVKRQKQRGGDLEMTAQADGACAERVWETERRVFVSERQIPIKRCEIRHRRRVSPQLKSLWIKLDLLLMKPLNPPLSLSLSLSLSFCLCVCVCVCLMWYYGAIVGSVSPYHRLRSFAVDATPCSL